ncbi:MAG: tyrosine recombinase XerC [Gammaproteobacteria bacterium]|nr:tyrosine recombinase XerC [Gammaproteobacteria bacterium]
MDLSLKLVPEPFQKEIVQYLDYLKYERGYSKHTLSSYQATLIALSEFFEQSQVKDWRGINHDTLRVWLVELRQKGLKPRSMQLKLSSVKGLFKFLVQRQKISQNPTELLVIPKADKPLPKNMEVDEVSQLLNFIPEQTIEKRDKAIMELFYSSGIRLSELAAINLVDLDTPSGELRVLGKGNKERLVPVGKVAVAALSDWLKCRAEFLKAESPALFLSQLGNRLSVRQIQQRLSYWAKRQGLNNTLHPHKLRHSFASHVLESSGDLRAVQELLGHANLSTTQVYTHLDFQHLAKVYDQAHPRAKKS